MALSQSRLMAHEGLDVRVWDREFMFRAHSYMLERESSPYRRLSATLIVAAGKPFKLSTENLAPKQYKGVLISPNVIRNKLEAEGSDLLLVDVGITSPLYAALAPLVEKDGVRALNDDEYAKLLPIVQAASQSEFDQAQAEATFIQAVEAVAGKGPYQLNRDPRVEKAITYLDETPLDEVDFSHLTEITEVSPSYLRSLFRKNLRCTASEYAAWVAAWRVVNMWADGTLFTDIALEAGFHDLSHMDHTVRRFYGITPTTVIDKVDINFQRYEGSVLCQ